MKILERVLEKRALLPDKPSVAHLKGQYIRLEPLVLERDAQPLFEVSNGSAIQLGNRSIRAYDADELIWCYMFDGPFIRQNLENMLYGDNQ